MWKASAISSTGELRPLIETLLGHYADYLVERGEYPILELDRLEELRPSRTAPSRRASRRGSNAGYSP
jgi:hypothetical protein